MKKIITIILAVLSVPALAQKKGVYCDPSLTNLVFTNGQNGPVNADMLLMGSPVTMRFTMSNFYSSNPYGNIPAGSCLLKVTLGTNCFLLTDVMGAGAPMSNYFHWKVDADPLRQTIITGTLYKDFPVESAEGLSFSFMPSHKGSSLITAQLLVTNNNNPTNDNNPRALVLADMNSGNNIVSRNYTNFSPLAVDFVQFSARAHACDVNINWQVSADDNISSYVVETSDNGGVYVPVKTILSNGTKIYNLVLGNITTTGSVYVRIKAVAPSGQTLYSDAVLVNNICGGKLELTLYPNPASSYENELTISAKEGVFNGKYSIRLLDEKGAEINSKDVKLLNASQVKYNTGFISGGSYQLVMIGEDGLTHTLKFIKQ